MDSVDRTALQKVEGFGRAQERRKEEEEREGEVYVSWQRGGRSSKSHCAAAGMSVVWVRSCLIRRRLFIPLTSFSSPFLPVAPLSGRPSRIQDARLTEEQIEEQIKEVQKFWSEDKKEEKKAEAIRDNYKVTTFSIAFSIPCDFHVTSYNPNCKPNPNYTSTAGSWDVGRIYVHFGDFKLVAGMHIHL